MAATDQLSCEVGGEIVILNLVDDTYYGLTEVGAFVWRMLGEPRSAGEMRDAVLAEFEVEPAVCEADLARLLEDLSSRGLVLPVG